MKKILITILMFMPLIASAYDVEIDGIYYNIVSKVYTATVTSGNTKYSGDVVIPEQIEYEGHFYKVKEIGESAFSSSKDLSSVSLPSSIVSIGSQAFEWCINLTSLQLQEGLKNIGYYAFVDCHKLSSIQLPSTLESIDLGAFLRCRSLQSISIPSGITTIETHTFNGCTNLSNIIIPNSVVTINPEAFKECENIQEIILPSNITSIGQSAFKGCKKLNGIILPYQLETIASYTFQDCIALKTISIPDHVSEIKWGAFQGCRGLASIYISKRVYSIDNYAFSGCDNLIDVYCYRNEPPFTKEETFKDAYIEYATLHVPNDFISVYKTKEPWSNFKSIVPLSSDNPTQSEKCVNPTISYANGKLTFNCDTEGAECVAIISDADIKTHYGNEISLTATYTVSVYATATGFENSDIVTATLCWLDAEPKTEGMASNITTARGNAILIQSNNGTINIEGVTYGTDITIYSSAGMMVGSAKALCSSTSVSTGLRNGEIAIVKIGDKSVKLVMK